MHVTAPFYRHREDYFPKHLDINTYIRTSTLTIGRKMN